MTTTARRIYVACLASYNNGVLHGTWIDTEGVTDADDIHNEVRDKVLLTSRFPNVLVTCPDCEGDNTLEEQLDNVIEEKGWNTRMLPDGRWVAEESLDAMNFVGATRLDALKAFRDGLDIFVDLCGRCHGRGKLPSAEEWAIHDHEGYPDGVIGEYTSFSEIAAIEEVLDELHDGEMEAFLVYASNQGGNLKDVSVDSFREAYRGEWSSHADFAYDFAVECEQIKKDSPMFSYIDWDHYWNGCLRFDFWEEKGHYFWNH
jgi:antirestriction protein